MRRHRRRARSIAAIRLRACRGSETARVCALRRPRRGAVVGVGYAVAIPRPAIPRSTPSSDFISSSTGSSPRCSIARGARPATAPSSSCRCSPGCSSARSRSGSSGSSRHASGEVRDVLLNLIAIASGLLFSLGLDPPIPLTLALSPASGDARRSSPWSSLVVFGGFFQSVHLGYEIGDAEAGVFRSRYSAAELAAIGQDRARAVEGRSADDLVASVAGRPVPDRGGRARAAPQPDVGRAGTSWRRATRT